MTVVIIWDGVVFVHQEGKTWKRGEYVRLDEAADLLRDHLPRGAKIRLIYDPEALVTELEEAPKGNRRIVGLALADRHPAITSETQVWGFQPQWPLTARGTFATFLHAESGTGYLQLRDRLERDLGAEIEGAWPLLTCALQTRPERGRAVLSLLYDAQRGALFAGGYQPGGERLSAKLRHADASRLWAEVHEVLRSAGANLGNDGGLRARVNFYATCTAEQVGQSCSFWSDLQQRNDVHFETLDSFARVVRHLPLAHPSNLSKALPEEFRLDGFLKTFTVVAGLGVVAAGCYFGARLAQLSSRKHILDGDREGLVLQQRHFENNKQEITNLKLLYGSDVGWMSPGRAEFLRALAAAIPAAASITELVLDEAGSFSLTGCFWQPLEKEDAKGALLPLEQALTAAMPSLVILPERSAFEPKTGRFSLSGLLNKD